jgi:hypothetical protein
MYREVTVAPSPGRRLSLDEVTNLVLGKVPVY